MGPLLFFRGGDEVACAMYPEKIDMIYAGDQVINIITGGANKQLIALGWADGESENVLKVLAAAMAGLTS